MSETTGRSRNIARIMLFAGVAIIAVLTATILLHSHRETPAVALGTIPFTDGESWSYKWTQGGQPVGTLTTTITAGTVSGKPVWVFTNETRTGADPAAAPVKVTRVTADAATQLPLSTSATIEAPDGHYEINITYSAKEASYAAKTPKGDQSGAAQLAGATYDNDQAPMLIRALPLAEGYKARLTCLQSLNVVVYTAAVKVEGQEELVVGNEKVSCWRVSFTVNGGAQTFWYATTPDHRLIRIGGGANGTFELQSSTVAAGGQMARMPAQ